MISIRWILALLCISVVHGKYFNLNSTFRNFTEMLMKKKKKINYHKIVLFILFISKRCE